MTGKIRNIKYYQAEISPHGVANTIILPTVMAYNAPQTADKYKYIAVAMRVGTENMAVEEYRQAAIDAVRQLSVDVSIPTDLKDIVKEEDIPFFNNIRI